MIFKAFLTGSVSMLGFLVPSSYAIFNASNNFTSSLELFLFEYFLLDPMKMMYMTSFCPTILKYDVN